MDSSPESAPAPAAAPATAFSGGQPSTPDIGTRIAQFLALRDKIAAIKEEQAKALQPFNAAKAKLEEILQEHLKTANLDSIRVKGIGTAYKATESSATVQDADAFRSFVLQTGDWDMADIRANKAHVRKHIEKHGNVPPGVKFTQAVTINVRRDSAGSAE